MIRRFIDIENFLDFSIEDGIVCGIQKTTDTSFSLFHFMLLPVPLSYSVMLVHQIQLHGYSMIAYTFKMDSPVSDRVFLSGMHIQIRVTVL